MFRLFLTASALLLVISGSGAAQEASDSHWADLIARDGLVSFTTRTELSASLALQNGALDQDGRAAALYALGVRGRGRGRAQLEAALAAGPVVERCAAVLALGEIGLGVDGLLESVREDEDPLVVECALLALMRSGRWAAARYVEAVAEDEDDARAQMAGRVLLFATHAQASEESAASALLLELRWNAARLFGLVEGRAWETVLLEELIVDPGFLRELVITASADLTAEGVKDHIYGVAESELAATGGAGEIGEATLRAALRAMPEEVLWLVSTGLWPAQWDLLLSEVADQRLQESTMALLIAAYEYAPVRTRVLSLMVRSGDVDQLPPLMKEIRSGKLGPKQLIYCCEALGESGNQAAAPTLELIVANKRPEVAWAALVQLARLGDSQAAQTIRVALADPSAEAHQTFIHLGCRFIRDPNIRDLLVEALPNLRGLRSLEVAVALTDSGHEGGRDSLREILHADLPASRLGARAITVLAVDASVEDEAYIRRQFPFGEYGNQEFSAGELQVNQALALALIRLRDPVVLPLIRAGIWELEGFNESVLASGLLVEIAGLSALMAEVDKVYVPVTGREAQGQVPATRARRFGYALGLFGGTPVLEEAFRGKGVRDPALQGAVLGALASRTH